MVQLTELAAAEIKKTLAGSDLPETTFLRVGVSGGGCSGFSYSLQFSENSDGDDVVSEQHGVNVVMENRYLPYLQGTVIDYHAGLNQRGFTFNNPNAARSCGCGSSFSPKDDTPQPPKSCGSGGCGTGCH